MKKKKIKKGGWLIPVKFSCRTIASLRIIIIIIFIIALFFNLFINIFLKFWFVSCMTCGVGIPF